MSYRPHYVSGDWQAVCDACGKKFKASKLIKRWDGLMVCQADWEPRHPQDFVRAKADLQAPKWTRPESSDTFVPINYTRQVIDYVITLDSFYLGDSEHPVDTSTTSDVQYLSFGKFLADSSVTSETFSHTIVYGRQPVINGSEINTTTLG
jgi:hypothetical protein